MTISQHVRPTFSIVPQGPFDLRRLALFGFGERTDPSFDGVMRLAFCVDGYAAQVGVEVRQDSAGVHCAVTGTADVEVVRAQVARMLSLDHDAAGYVAVGERDPVVARVLEVAPGLRPALFHSPYEAAAWAVLSARRPARQMAAVRRSLSEAHGAVFDLAGERCAAFPTPEQLLTVTEFPGLQEAKIERLHGIARAAVAGELDATRIVAEATADEQAAHARLQRLPGIGPFYSSLIVIRSSGVTDVLPASEPRLLDLVRRLYGLDAAPSPAEFARLAEPWRPFRTWVAVLLRSSGAGVAA